VSLQKHTKLHVPNFGNTLGNTGTTKKKAIKLPKCNFHFSHSDIQATSALGALQGRQQCLALARAAWASLVAVCYKLVLFAVDNMPTAEDKIVHKRGLAWDTGEVRLVVVADIGGAMGRGIAVRDREGEVGGSMGHNRSVEGLAERAGIVDIETVVYSIDLRFGVVVGAVAGVVVAALED